MGLAMNNMYGIEASGINQNRDYSQQAASDALLAQANALVPTKRVSLQASLDSSQSQIAPELAQTGIFGSSMSAQWRVLQDQRTGQKYIDCGGQPQALSYNPQDNTYSFESYEQTRIGNVHKTFRMRPTSANSFVGYEDIDQIGQDGQICTHVRYNLNGYSQGYYEQNAYPGGGIYQLSQFPIRLPNQPQYAHQLRQLMKMPYNQFESHVSYPRAWGQTLCGGWVDPRQQARYMGYQFARPYTPNVYAPNIQGYEAQQMAYAQPYAQMMPQYMGYQNGMPRDYQGNYGDYQGYQMAKPRGFFGQLKDYLGYKLGIGRPTTYYPQLGHYMGYVNGRPRNYVPMRGPAHPPGYEANHIQKPQEVMSS